MGRWAECLHARWSSLSPGVEGLRLSMKDIDVRVGSIHIPRDCREGRENRNVSCWEVIG